MTEVNSVNGKTGAVVLAAADVEAVPESQAGQPNGVATLDSGGQLPEAQLPHSVLTSRPKALEASGEVTPNITEGNAFAITATGNVTINPPINAIATEEAVPLYLIQDSTGGHTVTFSGVFGLLGNKAPVISTASNARTLVTLLTQDKGSTWYVVGLQPGEEGPKGEKGSTGSEGFVPDRVLLPSEFSIWKGVAEVAEKRQVLFESYQRGDANTTLLLTSGIPVAAAVPMKAGEILRGIGFIAQTAEGTPTNRTHLWAALLNATGEVLAVSADYSSSTSNSISNGEDRGLRFTSNYETTTTGVFYAVLCEVMSSTNPITIVSRNINEVAGAKVPMLTAVAGAATTPPAVKANLTLTKSEHRPYLVLL